MALPAVVPAELGVIRVASPHSIVGRVPGLRHIVSSADKSSWRPHQPQAGPLLWPNRATPVTLGQPRLGIFPLSPLLCLSFWNLGILLATASRALHTPLKSHRNNYQVINRGFGKGTSKHLSQNCQDRCKSLSGQRAASLKGCWGPKGKC